jgi:hypothetical protein
MMDYINVIIVIMLFVCFFNAFKALFVLMRYTFTVEVPFLIAICIISMLFYENGKHRSVVVKNSIHFAGSIIMFGVLIHLREFLDGYIR